MTCLVKDNLGLVELRLDAHNGVGLLRVLVLDDSRLQFRERNAIRRQVGVADVAVGRRLRSELFEKLGEQAECGPHGIFGISNDHA